MEVGELEDKEDLKGEEEFNNLNRVGFMVDRGLDLLREVWEVEVETPAMVFVLRPQCLSVCCLQSRSPKVRGR